MATKRLTLEEHARRLDDDLENDRVKAGDMATMLNMTVKMILGDIVCDEREDGTLVYSGK